MTLREVRNFNLRSFSVDIFSVFLSTSISGHPRFDLSHFWWHWRPIFGFREKRKSRQVGRPVMCHLIILLHSSPHLSYYMLTCFNLFPINEIMFSKQILYKTVMKDDHNRLLGRAGSASSSFSGDWHSSAPDCFYLFLLFHLWVNHVRTET